jgi:hypothetical protein
MTMNRMTHAAAGQMKDDKGGKREGGYDPEQLYPARHLMVGLASDFLVGCPARIGICAHVDFRFLEKPDTMYDKRR